MQPEGGSYPQTSHGKFMMACIEDNVRIEQIAWDSACDKGKYNMPVGSDWVGQAYSRSDFRT
jgi:hypothetical protein